MSYSRYVVANNVRLHYSTRKFHGAFAVQLKYTSVQMGVELVTHQLLHGANTEAHAREAQVLQKTPGVLDDMSTLWPRPVIWTSSRVESEIIPCVDSLVNHVDMLRTV